MAASEAAKEAVHLRSLYNELTQSEAGPTRLHLDCKAAIDTTYNPEHHSTKWILVAAAQLCRSSSSVAAAAPSQQQLRRSSSSVTVAAPSEQHYNLILKWSYHRRILLEVLPAAPRHWQSLEEGRELLLLRSINSSRSSISSVAAAAGGGNVPRR